MPAKTTHRGTKADRIVVAGKTAAGYSVRFIANEMALSPSFVQRWARHFRLYGHVDDHARPGRPRRRTAVYIERVRKVLDADDGKSIRDVALELEAAGEPASVMTTWRAAHDSGLYPYRRERKPLLTAAHKQARLRFAQSHRTTDWRRVLFVDEFSQDLLSPPNPQNERRWLPKGAHPEPVPAASQRCA